MVQTALRCSGINFGGGKCGNMTTNPSGLCSKHENARSQLSTTSILPKASSQSLRPVNSSSHSASSESWKLAMSPSVQLRIEQEEVANKAFDAFVNQDKDRVQVRAACGMGKTIMEQATILKYDDYLQETEGRTGNYLFVVPTVALANQMAQDLQNDGVIQGLEYDETSPENSDILIVHNQSKQFEDTPDKLDSHNQIVADFMEKESDAPKIVITVINSVDKVIGGQKLSDQRFDISLFDEAHNYSGEIDPDKKPDDKRAILPIYFDEQKDALQSDNRMFLTATPRMKSKTISGGFSQGESSADKIIELSKKKSSAQVNLYQDGSSPEVFGEHIGNWGYRHAIDAQYLTKAEFHSNTVMAYARNIDEMKDINRKTKVNAQGNVSLNKNDLSYGSYISMRSIADSIANQGSRNVLSFLDSIEECEESKRTWSQYLLDLAAAKNGRQFINDDDARMAVISGSDDQKLAGKYYLMSKHSSVTYSSSKSSEDDKKEAIEFFDKNEIGDRAKCTCEKPGGWCACARIVHNVDMFSEGVSIKSIDTVVLNRPRYSSDANINQAIGRASRKMEGKSTGKVIIPRGLSQTKDQRGEGDYSVPLDDRGYLKTLGAINRIWNDLDGSYIDQSFPETAESPVLHEMSIDQVPSYYFRESRHISDESSYLSNFRASGPEENAIIAMVWGTALKKAEADWNKSNGDYEKFSSLTKSKKEKLAREKRVDLYTDLIKKLPESRVRQSMDILDNTDISYYDSAMASLSTHETSAERGEFGYNQHHEKADVFLGRAKEKPTTNTALNGGMKTKTGFSRDTWDNLINNLFS